MKNNLFQMMAIVMAVMMIVIFVSCSSDDDENSANKNTLIGEWVSVPGGKGNAYDLTYQFNSDGTGFYKSSGGVWADFNYTTSGGYDAPTGSIYFRFVFVNSEYHSVWRSESSGSYRVFGDSLRLTTDGINTRLYTRKQYK